MVSSLLKNAHSSCYLCHQASNILLCRCCQQDWPSLQAQSLCQRDLLQDSSLIAGLVPPSYHSLHVLGEFAWPINILVSRLKFNRNLVCAELLSTQFIRYSPQLPGASPDVIIPMPLSPLRYMQRGFNQCTELGHYLSRHYGIPLAPLLRKNKHTQRQSSRKRDERHTLPLDTYEYCGPAYEHVILLDDVVTTGATLHRAASAISKVSPDTLISVWCMGIALSDAHTPKQLHKR